MAAILCASLAMASPRAPESKTLSSLATPCGPLTLGFLLGAGLVAAAVILRRRRPSEAALEAQVWERTRQLLEVNRQLELSIARWQQTQAKLIAADRLASLGALASAVAHELNNPLAFVSSNLRFVKGELEVGASVDPVDLTVALGEALEGAERMAEIIRDLRRLSRCEGDEACAVEVLPLLDAATNVTFSPVRGKASLVKDFKPLPKVTAHEGRLGQVFLNLMLNAVQALSFEAERPPEVRVSTWTCPDGRAAVEIGDNGRGLSEEQRARIFEPTFTSEPDRVGLSICDALIRELGGELEAHSRPGEGTRFRVLLPPAKAPLRASPTDASGVVILDGERAKPQSDAR